MVSQTKTVTTTASQVVDASTAWRTIYLHVTGNGIVYLGGSDVTSTNGFLTEKNAIPFTFVLPAGETLWAVTASGTEDLRILEPTAQ